MGMLIIHYTGDRYTRILLYSEKVKFYESAFSFLKTSFANWRPSCQSTSNKDQTVEEDIDEFQKYLIDKKIYMSWKNRCKFKRYIQLAKNLADSWSRNEAENSLRYQKQILNEIDFLSKKIGKEAEYKQLCEQYSSQ